MLDRIRLGLEPLAAAAVKMSRRKQACPSRSVKALDDQPAVEEGETAIGNALTSAELPDKDCDNSSDTSPVEAKNVLEESTELGPLVINTDASTPPPPSSTLEDTPPLTEETSPDIEQLEEPPHPPDSPGLDIPPSTANVPLSLTLLPASPTSPDHPSTPSSLNSSCSLLESSANKQRRGKKIMPVAGDDGKSRWQCPICSEQLGSDHDFTVHIRSHNAAQAKQPNTCTICGKVLSSQSSLDRHMLVHSGERPFRCKVCKMSFTTNGNMHRHSRIHNKEELKAAQAAAANEGGKSSKSSTRSSASAPKVPPVSSATDFSSNGDFRGVTSSTWHRPGVFNAERSTPSLPTPVSGVDLQKLMAADKLVPPQHIPFPSVVHNAFTMQMNLLTQMMENSRKRQLLSKYPEEDVSPSKIARTEVDEDAGEPRPKLSLPSSVSADKEPSAGANTSDDNVSALKLIRKSPNKRLHHRNHKSDQQHTAQDECKHCGKTFLGGYGLDNHLNQYHKDDISADIPNEEGADERKDCNAEDIPPEVVSNKCNKCEEVFSSQHKLLVHNLLDHLTSQQAEQAVAEALGEQMLQSGKNGISKVTTENTERGFSDVSFMDFTSDKFSLAAKAWCEEMPRKANSQFHDFTCAECGSSFPSRSSLVFHLASHKPQNWTKCFICNCHFVSSDQLRVHMNKHASDNAFEESRESENSEMAGQPESMGKNSFLAMFCLVARDELTGSKKNEEIIEAINKEQNNHYFQKLCKSSASKKARQNDSADSKTSCNQEDLGPAVDSISSNNPSASAHENPSLNTPVSSSTSSPSSSPAAAQDGMMSSGLIHPFMASRTGVLFNKADLYGQEFGLPGQSPQHQGRFVSPLPSSPSILQVDGEAARDQKKGIKSCQYCGASFLNERALKGHVRVHMGLSPYKCKFCSYSSADKSTLIRHMRTHNGQRPFKCNICEFPFTTKANCERHVRKRHGVTTKEEMERSVTFENCPTDPSDSIENFKSPDTVCQFCGEDFKFFRALKNHLKSHSSCREKPFACTKCLVGFSMKANAIRHVQKQHMDVPHKDIENFILVNELVQMDVDDDSDNLGGGYDTGSPSPSSTPGASSQDTTPPKAHSTPVYNTNSKNLSQSLAHPDGPLDFSLRNPEIAARLTSLMYPSMMSQPTKVEVNSEDTGEQPIDLTTKRKSFSPAPSSAASLSPGPSTPSTPIQLTSSVKGKSSEVLCSLCDKTFTTKEAAQQHLIEVHQINPSSFLSLPNSDNNNNTSSATLSAFMPMSMVNPLQYSSQLTTLMQARAAAGAVPVFSTHPAFPNLPKLAYLASPRSIHSSLLAGMQTTNVKKEPSTDSSTVSSGSESSCDLASVNKIIESTNSQNIQIFLKPQAANSGSDDSEPQTTPWESADEDSDQSLEQLYKQSLNGKIKVKSEVIPEEMVIDDGGDEDADKPGEESDEEDKESDTEMNVSDMKNRLMEDDAQEDMAEMNNFQSPDSKLLAEHAVNKSESGAFPVKKKRNSYADSPHKLNCPHCPRSFPWVSSLNRHMLTHTGQKPFKCPRCPVTFSTKSNRERHLIRKHGVNMLDPASRQTMDRPYKCHLCVFSSFSTESNLLKHYKERHPGDSPPERYLMKMEAEAESLDLGQQMDRMDEMALAGMDNSNVDGWSENTSMDADDMETAQASTSATKTVVSTMVENVVAALLKKEPKGSPTPPAAATPTDTSHNNGFDDNEEDSSDMTLASVAFSGSAERHINPERDNYNVDKITYCWKCSEQFNSRKLLVRHLKEHNIDLPFKCYLCDASYDSRQECLCHQEKSHSSDWAILKDKNGVDSIETYARHLDRIVERNCRTGQFVEEGEDPGEAVVAVAAGEEGQAEMVASDYLQRKVYCSLCSKRFWSLQDLRRHMRSHTGERPFECDKCHKRFTLKHSMMRHRRKHTTAGNTDSPTIFSDDEDDIQTSENSGKVPAANMGSGHKALRQHLAAAAVRANGNIPTTVTENHGSQQTIPNGDDKDENGDIGDDILHNLLGVESATIDQIIDAKGSAASLLGVCNKAGQDS